MCNETCPIWQKGRLAVILFDLQLHNNNMKHVYILLVLSLSLVSLALAKYTTRKYLFLDASKGSLDKWV